MAAATAAAIIAAAATTAAAGASIAGAGGSSSPRPPNYTKQIVKGVAAENMVLPDKIRGELSARQQFDLPALAQTLAYMQASNAGIQEQSLDASKVYAPQQVEQARALVSLADPNRLETRDKVGEMVMAELALGRNLSPQQDLAIKDSIRGRQVAQGITDGTMPVLSEAMDVERYKDEVRARRLSDAGNFLAMPSLAEMASGLPSGYNPMQGGDTFRLFDPRAGQSAANYASQNFATSAGNPQPNQWMQGLGLVAGAAGRYAGWQSSQPAAAPVQSGGMGATNSWIPLN